MRGRSPHVDEVGVADAVRDEARHADHTLAISREGNVLGLLERAPERLGAPAVVEMVRGEVRLGLLPVDSLERGVDPDGHARTMTAGAGQPQAPTGRPRNCSVPRQSPTAARRW